MEIVKEGMQRVDVIEKDVRIGWDEGRWSTLTTPKGRKKKKKASMSVWFPVIHIMVVSGERKQLYQEKSKLPRYTSFNT